MGIEATQTPISRFAGFKLPTGFDVASYDQVHECMVKVANPNDTHTNKNSWYSYGSAWNGMAIRLRSTIEYSDEFVRLITFSTSPPFEERYSQERALFGCVTAALSAIECFYMATYCVGTVIEPAHFSLQAAGDLNLSPHKVANIYHTWLPADAFSISLRNVVHSNEFKKLSNLRNALAHRGVMPRQHHLSTVRDIPSTVPSNPKELAEDFDYSESLGDETTLVHSRWVCQTTSSLVTEFYMFLADKV